MNNKNKKLIIKLLISNTIKTTTIINVTNICNKIKCFQHHRSTLKTTHISDVYNNLFEIYHIVIIKKWLQ
jgi:hypothetical protein